MNAPTVAERAQSKALSPIKEFQHQVEQREATFASTLPTHIPAERFKRVVLRSVQKSPDLLNADRASLFNAAMDAANDGLLPDGREAAFVVFNTKQGKKIQYMPMIFGVLKKIRNSGELKAISVRVVYAGDQFRYWIDENGEHLTYEAADNPDKSIVRRVFAQALTKDGGVYIEVMDVEDIEKVRAVSRAKNNGPWVDWWEEMAKKTVLRRLAKRLPMSTDLDDLMRRDDHLYDFDGARERPKVEAPKMLNDRLDALADMSQPNDTAGHQQTVDHEEGQDEDPSGGAQEDDRETGDADGDEPTAVEQAARLGRSAARKGMNRKAVPAEFRQQGREDEYDAWLAAYDDEAGA